MQGYYNGEIPFGKWKEYYDNANRIRTMEEYEFENGQKQGSDKYYHTNGQLWTERIYKEGKLWDILCNNNMEGKPLGKGSLKNGNGDLKIYNEGGKLLETLIYSKGVKVK